MENMVNSASGRAQRPEIWIERAVRHPLHIPLRYRLEGLEDWSPGETVNLSESGVLFSSAEMLEVNSRVEITFQTSGNSPGACRVGVSEGDGVIGS